MPGETEVCVFASTSAQGSVKTGPPYKGLFSDSLAFDQRAEYNKHTPLTSTYSVKVNT